MSVLDDFRAQNPAYKDVPDDKLADGLYNKYYSAMPRDQFDTKIGMSKISSNPYSPATKIIKGTADTISQIGKGIARGAEERGLGILDLARRAGVTPKEFTPDAIQQAKEQNEAAGKGTGVAGFIGEELGHPENYIGGPLEAAGVRGIGKIAGAMGGIGSLLTPTPKQALGDKAVDIGLSAAGSAAGGKALEYGGKKALQGLGLVGDTAQRELAKRAGIDTKGPVEDFQKSLLGATENAEQKLAKSAAGGQAVPKIEGGLPSEQVALNTANNLQGGLDKLWKTAQDNYRVLSKVGSKVDITDHPAVKPVQDFLANKPPDVTIPGGKGLDRLLVSLGSGGETGARKVTLADLDVADRRLKKAEASTKDGKTADYIAELRGRIDSAIKKASMVRDAQGRTVPGSFAYYRGVAAKNYATLKALTDGETARSLGLDKSMQQALHRLESGEPADIGNAVTSALGLERRIQTTEQIKLLKTLIPNPREFQKLMGSTVEYLAQANYKNLENWQANKEVVKKIIAELPYKPPSLLQGMATLDKLYTNIEHVGGPKALAPKEFRNIRQISNRIVDAGKAAIATIGSHGAPTPYAAIKASEAVAPSDSAKAKALKVLQSQMKPKPFKPIETNSANIPGAALTSAVGTKQVTSGDSE